MDAPRDDPRQYADRFTLPPLEYASDRPPPTNIKYPPSSPIVTLPSLHSPHNQHNQHSYQTYPPQDRPPPMHPQDQSVIFSPLQPGTGSAFQFGRQPPETRQVRKIGQRRDAAEDYRKLHNNNNGNLIGSGQASRPPPPPQHQQGRPLSQQSSPTFGPPMPMHDPYPAPLAVAPVTRSTKEAVDRDITEAEGAEAAGFERNWDCGSD
ncbi:hypothetical protein V498_10402 [Pseudogymnoascus sp. VKM F-4517 (FW-2822)]|nr:hypothetical protein V498_10402 [Pseudogymnoascus sp. VKM F-4517 (FW-2822)]